MKQKKRVVGISANRIHVSLYPEPRSLKGLKQLSNVVLLSVNFRDRAFPLNKVSVC